MTVTKVEKLFKRIQQEQAGKLDLLVSNAYAGVKEHFKSKLANKEKETKDEKYVFQVNTIFTSTGKKFWETNPTETWDMING